MIAYDRAGRGEPLVLIHGIGSNRRAWDTILPYLTDTFDVITIDLPGFGESPELEEGNAVSAVQLAQAVRDLCESIGVERPHVAGNSLGGWVALELARMGAAASAVGICPAGLWNTVPHYTMGMLRFNRTASRSVDGSLERIIRLPGSRAAAAVYGKPWKVPKATMVEEIRVLGHSPGFDRVLASFPKRGSLEGRVSTFR